MSKPTRIAVPHSIGKEEARRRLLARSGDIAGIMPSNVGTATVSWASEYQMMLAVTAMGQQVPVSIDIGEKEVVVMVTLPGMRGFFGDAISKAVQQKGQKLLG